MRLIQETPEYLDKDEVPRRQGYREQLVMEHEVRPRVAAGFEELNEKLETIPIIPVQHSLLICQWRKLPGVSQTGCENHAHFQIGDSTHHSYMCTKHKIQWLAMRRKEARTPWMRKCSICHKPWAVHSREEKRRCVERDTDSGRTHKELIIP